VSGGVESPVTQSLPSDSEPGDQRSVGSAQVTLLHYVTFSYSHFLILLLELSLPCVWRTAMSKCVCLFL
jgi:hypothetical protein